MPGKVVVRGWRNDRVRKLTAREAYHLLLKDNRCASENEEVMWRRFHSVYEKSREQPNVVCNLTRGNSTGLGRKP